MKTILPHIKYTHSGFSQSLQYPEVLLLCHKYNSLEQYQTDQFAPSHYQEVAPKSELLHKKLFHYSDRFHFSKYIRCKRDL